MSGGTPAAMAPTAPHDVVIVGAGMAGLGAATALVRAGRRVVVHEARERVGGRVHSVPVAGGAVELGATWFWPNEPRMRSLVARAGLESFAQHLAGDALFEPERGTVRRLDGNPIDGPSLRVDGGSARLPQALADALPGGVLRLSDPAANVTIAGDHVNVGTAGGTTRARHVLLALPPALAMEQVTFSPGLPARLRELAAGTAVWMGQVVKAIAVFDEPFWRARGLAGAALSHAGPFREFHDHSGPDGAAPAIFAFAPAAGFAACPVDEIEHAFVDQLARLFGPRAGRPREVHLVDWSRERFTQPAAEPGGTSAGFGAPEFQEAIAGRIHWASTETATAYAGHVEGAVLAGLAAAERIDSALGD